jgi:glycerophosphoryl diester phosphodiesterase
MSFHAAVVRAVKQHRPAWRVLRLLHARPSARWLDCFLADIRAGRLDGLGQNRAWSLPLAHYAALRDAGALLSVWTVNDPAEARLWRARGFHYLTTDIPEKFLRHSRP